MIRSSGMVLVTCATAAALRNAGFAELSAVFSGDRASRSVAAIPNAPSSITVAQARHHLMSDWPLALVSVARALLA